MKRFLVGVLAALFAEAGFELEQSVVTRPPFTILVGAPV
jgi:hypothetical protein